MKSKQFFLWTCALVAVVALANPLAVRAAACYTAWSSSAVYTAGMTASYSGVNYVANFWTQNQNPSTNNGGAGSGEPWTSQGACGSGGSCSASPSAPTGLAASGTTSSGTNLNWSAVTPPANCTVSSYTVYKGGTSIGTSSTTSFSVTGLTASTTYTFTVAATDSFGTSPQSSSISVTTSAASSCTANPGAPTGLAASGTTSSSTNLSWSAVTPPANCSVTSYTVYQGGSALATVGGTSYTASGLSASTTYTFTVAASDSHGTGSQSSSISVTTSSSGGGGGCSGVAAWNSTSVYTAGMQASYNNYLWTASYWTQNNVPTAGGSGPWNIAGYCGSTPGRFSGARSMPYVDVTLIAPYNAMNYSTSHYFTMAFVTDSGGCTPAWNGKPVSTNQLSLSAVQALRASGGDVSLSFGGANGTELATSCSSESALQAAYQSVISTYSLKRIDFDIEGGAPGNTSANDLRAKAVKALQSANPGLQVTFTLPVETYGLDAAPLALVQNAISNGVNITAVNGMSMDFGGSYDHGGQMYLDQQLTAWSLMAQLQSLLPGDSHAQIASMVGITPMIGQNDLSTEVFTTANASSTVSFAQQQGLGMLAFWSESRDHSCASGETNYLCSNISQNPGQFASIFEGL